MAAPNVWKRALPSSVRPTSPTRLKHTSVAQRQEQQSVPTGAFCDPIDHAGQHTVGDHGGVNAGKKNSPTAPGSIEKAQGHISRSSKKEDEHPPLIISLVLDETLQSHISKLREKYFPTSRNYLQGHITLFHAIPSQNLGDVKAYIESISSSTAAFHVGVRPPSLAKSNRAVFLPLSAQPLYKVHESLLEGFLKKLKLDLTDQDRHSKFWPHATVINKVGEEEAVKAYETLKETKEAQQCNKGKALGLDLWRYRGGPWQHIRRFDFSG